MRLPRVPFRALVAVLGLALTLAACELFVRACATSAFGGISDAERSFLADSAAAIAERRRVR